MIGEKPFKLALGFEPTTYAYTTRRANSYKRRVPLGDSETLFKGIRLTTNCPIVCVTVRTQIIADETDVEITCFNSQWLNGAPRNSRLQM